MQLIFERIEKETLFNTLFDNLFRDWNPVWDLILGVEAGAVSIEKHRPSEYLLRILISLSRRGKIALTSYNPMDKTIRFSMPVQVYQSLLKDYLEKENNHGTNL